MSYIIAATDFTDTSLNAVTYAANMAVATGYPLVMINAFSLPVMVGDVPLPATLIDDTRADMEKQMAHLVQTLAASHSGLVVTGEVKYGTVIDVIETYVAENRPPFITIMGNTNTRENSVWILSTLSDASGNMTLPVLAVPPEAMFKTAPVICLAIDLNMKDISAPLRHVADISTALRAQLHVVNVGNNDAEGNRLLSDSIELALLPARPAYHFIPSEEVEENIQNFCEQNRVKLLAVIHGRHSFFERLVHRSHTKHMAKTMQIPLLVLHEPAD
jgi:nucleotide-binding universal stress UspA family protein